MNKKTAVSMRTRQKIKEAFLELYAKKPITDITVGAIMQLAGYNRSTFYNYYDTAQDLLNEIEEEIIERVRKNSQRIFLDDQANINDVFSQIFSTFEQYGDTVYILLGNNGDAAFRLRVKETAKEVFRKITKVQIDAEKLEYVFSFAVSAALGLIEHWHATGKKYSTEEFLRFAKALISNGIVGVLTDDNLPSPQKAGCLGAYKNRRFEKKGETNMILETERLYLREMNQADYKALCKILQDEKTMYAYEGAFDDTEAQEWLDRQISRYQKWGFGMWAVILKETDEMIGQCGLTMQPWKDTEVLEIGYLFQRPFWHKGYATEAAKACKRYAFETLNAEEVCSIIRDTNTASQNVALRNGMVAADSWTKHYRGVDMPHVRYVVLREGQ